MLCWAAAARPTQEKLKGKNSKYRYALWHEPVLYDRTLNKVDIYSSWGLYGAAVRVFLFEAIYTAMHAKAQHEGHVEYPLVNNEIITIEKVR